VDKPSASRISSERDANRYVDTYAACRTAQEDAMAARELPGIFHARRIGGAQSVNKGPFTAVSRQHGEIDVQGDAWFAPSLHGQPAAEA
jgi:hypothetical protein